MAAATFPKIIAQVVVDAVGGSVGDDLVIEGTPNLADLVWKMWNQVSADADRKRADLQVLVRVHGDEADSLAESVVRGLAQAPDEMRKGLASYLRLVPDRVRQRCRRPSQPTGTAVPANLPLASGADVLELLPARLPWFDPGSRLADRNDWELQELLSFTSFGEIWKAGNPRHSTSAVLHFFVAPEAKDYVVREEPRGLDHVLMHAKHPGIVPLQKVYVQPDPPGVQYAFVAAAPLPSLLEEWAETGRKVEPTVVAELVRQIVQALGFLHQLHPPIVVGHLRPRNVLVQPSGESWQCLLSGVGLGPWSGRKNPREEMPLYLSPEQQRGQAPKLRDDVFALGILWYQMLTGNFGSGRPGGSHWRRKLADLGMAQNLIELLESCFEDDPNYRPADGNELAAKLGELNKPEKKPETEAAGRGRGRRPDIWQIFDSLDKSEPDKSKLITNSIELKLVLIPPGQLQMGSPATEPGHRVGEGPVHEVSITKPFYLSVVPITQKQYEQVMGRNPAFFGPAQGGDYDHPVESVTWEEAVAFCARLSARPEEKGRKYRLPTEAEWEYACRAGTSSLFSFGNALGSGQANFDTAFPHGGATGYALQKTSKVGLFPANNFGLYDMHGNVWEWCADWLAADEYRKSTRRDPTGPAAGSFRVLRGGSWRNQALTCRCAYRNGLAPSLRDRYTGFRVLLEG